MPITFACAASHVPGMTAWAEAAPVAQKDRVYGAFDKLRAGARRQRHRDARSCSPPSTGPISSSTTSARSASARPRRYSGPIEPWLKIEKQQIKGDPQLAAELIEAAYDNGFEPSFAHELEFDHGTMVPLHFIAPRMDRPGGAGDLQHARRAAAERADAAWSSGA